MELMTSLGHCIGLVHPGRDYFLRHSVGSPRLRCPCLCPGNNTPWSDALQLDLKRGWSISFPWKTDHFVRERTRSREGAGTAWAGRKISHLSRLSPDLVKKFVPGMCRAHTFGPHSAPQLYRLVPLVLVRAGGFHLSGANAQELIYTPITGETA